MSMYDILSHFCCEAWRHMGIWPVGPWLIPPRHAAPKNGAITCGIWFSLASQNRADYLLIPIKFLHHKFLAVK